MVESEKLKKYLKKRNFSNTKEPQGTGESCRGENLLFVIQKHDASSLHYDFRIEVDGVLKSWAIPKGPSTDPQVKRLAIPTEDHPLEYADFEGVIPEEEYGGGTVLIWDRGCYENIRTTEDGALIPLKRCLREGHIVIRLSGRKLTGGYALVRMDKGENGRWLLVKNDDSEADGARNPVSTEEASVVSGRDLQTLYKEEGNG
ncbi:MAG: DNA polymerase ligase N-terminal domain-containing protein [Desulfopila sp.]|jgi:DNA ligase D-like protein (predicted 3'-phosphoesterase)|nr:DNA polymerase ligase N-terminal domain-containing protein [Desulfopila sp.]